MIIDQSGSRQLRDALPTPEIAALRRALDDIGCEEKDVSLVPLHNKADMSSGDPAFIQLQQYGDLQITLKMKGNGSRTVFFCRLEFAKMPVKGMTDQELTRFLNATLKKSGYGVEGAAPQAPVQPTPVRVAVPSAREDEEEEEEAQGKEVSVMNTNAKGFTNREADVRAFLAKLVEQHGEGPHDRSVVVALLKSVTGSGRGTNPILATLLRKGYLLPEGGDKLRPIAQDEEPLLNQSIVLFGRKPAPALPEDDPIVVRQRAYGEMFEREAKKKAGLAGKKAELEAMLREKAERDAAIEAKQAEIELDEATLLSEDTLAELDRLLEKLGNSNPEALEALRKVS